MAQIVCQCALAQVSALSLLNSQTLNRGLSKRFRLTLLQVDSVFGGMLKSSKQQVDRGDATWADKFSVMLTPHNSQYAPSAARFETHLPSYLFSHRRRYTQHHHVTFKLREVVKPYKKVVGHAAVSLQGAVAACERGKAYSFLVPLRLQGLVCGMSLPPSLFSIPSNVICL
jgi:hypothetical protein